MNLQRRLLQKNEEEDRNTKLSWKEAKKVATFKSDIREERESVNREKREREKSQGEIQHCFYSVVEERGRRERVR